MGSLSLKKQNLSTLIPFQIGIDVYLNNLYTFKSATTNLLGTVFDPNLFNAPYGDLVNITLPNEGQLTFYFDGSTWVYGDDFVTNANNYIIPNNSIIQIQTSDITSVPVGGGAIIQNYFQGKTSIKKQNLSALKSLSFYPPQESIYIFKSAVNNTLGNIFNYAEFEPYADAISIYTQGNLDGFYSSFLTDGSNFVYDDFTTNANNYVIPANSLLTFSTSYDISITVGGGAIIQKYYSGKMSIYASPNFYRTILSAGIDSAIAGLTANDSTKKIFSTMTPNGICCNGDSSTDPVNPVFTRSTTCWAKNIDTSPISPWNNGGGYPAPEHAGGFGGTGTLISPRHIVYCNHFQIKVGKKLIFVDMNNNCYIRTISNSLQVGATDIRIGLLDSDLPSSVSFCKVASFDLTTITDTNNRVAALYLDQERKALVGDYFNSDSAGSLNISTNSQRANFYELPIGGDSACPINFVYNNKIILLFLFTSTFGGESIPYNIAAINSVMTTLGGGYTLSLFNKKDITST